MNLVGTIALGDRPFGAPVSIRIAPTESLSGPASVIRQMMSLPDDELDFAETKLAIDRLIDPAFDVQAVRSELDALTARAREMAGPNAPEAARLGAIRALLFEAGSWNDHRPIRYDHEDCFGRDRPNKMLWYVLRHRLGQCVSMPILFLIIADRLGLNVGLCSVPQHLFVRYAAPSGRVLNIEATSGGHPVRDSFIRERVPMSDRAVDSGLYLRTLTRRESAARIAGTLIEHLARDRRDEELIATAEILLQADKRCDHALVSYGSVFGRMADEFDRKYGSPFLIPDLLRPRYLALKQRNHAIFSFVESLGWREPDGN